MTQTDLVTQTEDIISPALFLDCNVGLEVTESLPDFVIFGVSSVRVTIFISIPLFSIRDAPFTYPHDHYSKGKSKYLFALSICPQWCHKQS